jgi:pyruvate-formate lyase-activating enzyme
MKKPENTSIQAAKDPANAKSRLDSLMLALREKRLLTLVVEPSSYCNLSCKFCDLHSGRMKDVGPFKGFMEFDLWSRAVDQMRSLNYRLKQLQFHGNGEPLMHKMFPEFIRLAVKSDIAESIRVTTNGTLLTLQILEKIVDAGADEIRVSVDAGNRALWRKLKGKSLFEKLERNILNAIEYVSGRPEVSLVLKYPVVGDKYNDTYGVTEEHQSSVIKGFSELIHVSNITLSGMPVVTLMDGLVHKAWKNEKPCEIPFYSLFMKFDGRISICCADCTNVLDIGSIHEEGFPEIISGKALRELRFKHLEGCFDDIPLCLHCGNRTCVDLSLVKTEVARLIQ